jgi:hypothetical protein
MDVFWLAIVEVMIEKYRCSRLVRQPIRGGEDRSIGYSQVKSDTEYPGFWAITVCYPSPNMLNTRTNVNRKIKPAAVEEYPRHVREQ